MAWRLNFLSCLGITAAVKVRQGLMVRVMIRQSSADQFGSERRDDDRIYTAACRTAMRSRRPTSQPRLTTDLTTVNYRFLSDSTRDTSTMFAVFRRFRFVQFLTCVGLFINSSSSCSSNSSSNKVIFKKIVMPQSVYAALSEASLIGLVILTFDILTSE